MRLRQRLRVVWVLWLVMCRTRVGLKQQTQSFKRICSLTRYKSISYDIARVLRELVEEHAVGRLGRILCELAELAMVFQSVRTKLLRKRFDLERARPQGRVRLEMCVEQPSNTDSIDLKISTHQRGVVAGLYRFVAVEREDVVRTAQTDHSVLQILHERLVLVRARSQVRALQHSCLKYL